jgi:hypothetical protein
MLATWTGEAGRLLANVAGVRKVTEIEIMSTGATHQRPHVIAPIVCHHRPSAS